MAVFLAFALPHAIFHLAHPADALNGREDAVNSLSLWGEVAIAVAVMLTALRGSRSAGVYGSQGPSS
jgi:hypothetical protein